MSEQTPTSWDPEVPSPTTTPTSAPERGLVADFFCFAWENKWWWIAPTLIILVGLGTLVIMAQGTMVAPFFYALF